LHESTGPSKCDASFNNPFTQKLNKYIQLQKIGLPFEWSQWSLQGSKFNLSEEYTDQ